MEISRREFLKLSAATAVVATCDCSAMAADGSSRVGGLVDAGPVSNFAKDGVYSNFRELGFFVIRKDGKLFALSSICTHRKTQLKAEPDCSFYCKRHGSTFAPDGHVTSGPATRDLPTLTTSVNGAGHLLVGVPVA
jgi:Rieske Fe-S protein